jgi:patatin-like phospholipase/acyl hydrolase
VHSSWLLIKDVNNKPKYTTDQLLVIFEELCKKIFLQVFTNRFTNGFGFFGSKYDRRNIKESLYEICQDIKIKDLLKPLTISTYDLVTGKPFYFNYENHPDINLIDALLASSAAPTIFDPYYLQINDIKHLFIDGKENCYN